MQSHESTGFRIAFVHMDSGLWTAGTHYLRNLFIALKSLDVVERPEIALLLPQGMPPASYASLREFADMLLTIPAPLPPPNFWQRQVIRAKKQLGVWQAPQPLLVSYLRSQQISCLFALFDFDQAPGIPLLSWIPDFQHVVMPEMFSADEVENRTYRYTRVFACAERLILSSQSVYADLSRVAPDVVAKARVLPFTAYVSPDTYLADTSEVCRIYHLPEKFIYLPNQFWRHKNHCLVLETLALLRKTHPEITIVCTGNTNDYRHPLYFGEFAAKISEMDLRDRIIILGVVPREHLAQLMRQSVAVLQPSLFEGWSTTVEEAKSIGKRLILSDIPTHREQNPAQSVYFAPRDSEALAECLIQMYRANPGPDTDLETLARKQLPERMRKFGRAFLTIARDASNDGPNP
jgi:glycosyltransferase involved in cell wall biosynthesis